MRTTFIQYLEQEAARDPNLYFIVGDVGFSVIEKFKEKYGNRYINAGIAEQNMIGVAAGLAMAGKNVYVYSIIPFVTMRCFEQIRNDLCYQQLPVKLIGVGGGFSYGPMGVTHHALEDVAVMRCLPGMTVVAPGSTFETEALLPHINTLDGPSYLRLSNNEELALYNDNTQVTIGKAVSLVPHDTNIIVACGNALDLGIKVQKHLSEMGIDIGLVSMPTIKPLDEDFFLSKNLNAVFTLEEHSVIGGLGEAISRFLCENFDHKIIFHAFGVNDFYYHIKGSRSYLNEKAGLNIDAIVDMIQQKIRLKTHLFNTSIKYGNVDI